jgi:hypothetical protein
MENKFRNILQDTDVNMELLDSKKEVLCPGWLLHGVRSFIAWLELYKVLCPRAPGFTLYVFSFTNSGN